MSQLRSSNEIRNRAVAQILEDGDSRGGTAPFGITEKRRAYLASRERSGELAPVSSITDDEVQTGHGPVAVRVYTEAGDTGIVVLYLHGGGFISGNLETHDPVCRTIASEAECTVVALDYRLAPEDRFPAALQDAQATAKWIRQRWPRSRFVVAGDSAGGNLAAVLALWARDEGALPLAGQVLIYPVLDATLSGASLVENALVPPFTLLDCVFMWQTYLAPDRDRRDPYISPLHALTLERLPATFLITAEFDILRSEGRAYAERLRSSHVAVEHWDVPDMPHGFMQWGGTVAEARAALSRIAVFISSLR